MRRPSSRRDATKADETILQQLCSGHKGWIYTDFS